MGDKPHTVLPVTPIRKDPRPLTPPAGSPQDVHEIKPATEEGYGDATELQSQKPFASPGKLMDGKPQPVAAPMEQTRDSEPTD